MTVLSKRIPGLALTIPAKKGSPLLDTCAIARERWRVKEIFDDGPRERC